MAPHQQRVIDEKKELDEKLKKLMLFIMSGTALYISLPHSEKIRLQLQATYMGEYSDILGQRIKHFNQGEAPYSETLEDYLGANHARRVIDHIIRADVDNDGVVTFYIHPHGTDGKTLDFVVKGNELSPKPLVPAE